MAVDVGVFVLVEVGVCVPVAVGVTVTLGVWVGVLVRVAVDVEVRVTVLGGRPCGRRGWTRRRGPGVRETAQDRSSAGSADTA